MYAIVVVNTTNPKAIVPTEIACREKRFLDEVSLMSLITAFLLSTGRNSGWQSPSSPEQPGGAWD
jgi:hypothetical protein